MDRIAQYLGMFVTIVGGVWFLACTVPFIVSMTFAFADGSDRVGNQITGIRIRETLADWWGRVDLRVEQPPRTLRPNLGPRATVVPVIVQPPAVQQPPVNAGASCGARMPDRIPVVGQSWNPPGKGTWRILNGWTNQPGFDQRERKLLLEPKDDPSLDMGGSMWTFCSEADARANYAANGLPPVSLDQLVREGLAR